MGQREETTEELSERVLARLRREYSLVSSEVWVDDVHRVDFVGFRPARNSPFPSSIERGEFVGYSNEIGEADLHDFLAAVLFGPGIKITGNRPIIGRLFELINRPVCVVRTLETDEGEIVPVCSNCGEPISLTDSFCPHCSAEVVGNEFDC